MKNKRIKIIVIGLIILLLGVVLIIVLNNATNKPIIKAKYNDWSKENLVSIAKDGRNVEDIKHYKYCIKKDNEKCKWEITDTKNVVISKSGKYEVYFKGIYHDNKETSISNKVEVRIDNDAPIISGLRQEVGSNFIKIDVAATDKLSGVKEYWYKLDNDEFKKGKKTFEFANLKENREYLISIRVVDNADNEILSNLKIKTSIGGE